MPVGETDLVAEFSDIESLAINGESLSFSGDSISTPVVIERGIHFIETKARGINGLELVDRRSVLAGEFAEANGDLEGAAVARVNRNGLDDIGEIVAQIIDGVDINSNLSSLNPVLDIEYVLGTSIAVDLENIDFGLPKIDIVPSDGRLHVTVELPDLVINALAYLSVVWIESEQTLDFTADSADVNAYLELSLNEGIIEVDPASLSVSLENFHYDVSLLPGEFLEDNLFADSIRETIEEKLAEKMQEILPEAIAGLQEDLDLRFEIELLGKIVALGASFADLVIDTKGIHLGLNLDIDAGGDLGEGYLFSGGAIPSPDKEADAAIMISDDVLNRAFYELWSGGVMNQTLSSTDGSLNTNSLSGFGIDEATVEMEAHLPPVVVEKNGQIELQIGELELDIYTPGFTLGENISLRLHASAQLDVGFENGALKPLLGEFTLNPDVTDTDWGQDEESIVNLIHSLAPKLLGAFEDISIELPTIDGISIDDVGMERAETGKHTGLSLNISAD